MLPGLSAEACRQPAVRQGRLEVARALADFKPSHRRPGDVSGRRGAAVRCRCRARARWRGRSASRRGARGRSPRRPAPMEGAMAQGPRRGRGGDRCLAHMDLGIGNILLGASRRWSCSTSATPGWRRSGADLHTVLLRDLGRAGAGSDDCVDAYVDGVPGKGIGVDPATVRRSARGALRGALPRPAVRLGPQARRPSRRRSRCRGHCSRRRGAVDGGRPFLRRLARLYSRATSQRIRHVRRPVTPGC